MTFDEASTQLQKAIDMHKLIIEGFGVKRSCYGKGLCKDCIWKDECSICTLTSETIKRVYECGYFSKSDRIEDEAFHCLEYEHKQCIKSYDRALESFSIGIDELSDRLCNICSHKHNCSAYNNLGSYKTISRCRYFDKEAKRKETEA